MSAQTIASTASQDSILEESNGFAGANDLPGAGQSIFSFRAPPLPPHLQPKAPAASRLFSLGNSSAASEASDGLQDLEGLRIVEDPPCATDGVVSPPAASSGMAMTSGKTQGKGKATTQGKTKAQGKAPGKGMPKAKAKPVPAPAPKNRVAGSVTHEASRSCFRVRLEGGSSKGFRYNRANPADKEEKHQAAIRLCDEQTGVE